MAGAFCRKEYDRNLIAGIRPYGIGSNPEFGEYGILEQKDSTKEMHSQYCTEYAKVDPKTPEEVKENIYKGAIPRCWFDPED